MIGHLLSTLACFSLIGICTTSAKPVPGPSGATNSVSVTNGLSDAVVLIIRHAEKPEAGRGLSPLGEQHAQNYAEFFKEYTLDNHLLPLDYLLAAGDSDNSQRPRLTLEPLSKATGLKLDLRFTHQDCEILAKALQSESHGKHILICWRRGEMPVLLQALGADPAKLLPGGTWPEEEYRWLIQLVYDHDGKLIPGKSFRRVL